MNEGKVATRYAKAVFETAREKKVLDKVYQDFKLILNTFNQSKEIKEHLQNPLLKDKDKLEVLNKLFSAHTDNVINQLFKLLVKNKRELYLPAIARVFADMYKHDRNIKTATLITAVKIQDDLKEKLVSFVKNTYQSEIELEEKINEDIIGGFVLRIDDQQFDASVSTQLTQIKNQFINTSVESIN